MPVHLPCQQKTPGFIGQFGGCGRAGEKLAGSLALPRQFEPLLNHVCIGLALRTRTGPLRWRIRKKNPTTTAKAQSRKAARMLRRRKVFASFSPRKS